MNLGRHHYRGLGNGPVSGSRSRVKYSLEFDMEGDRKLPLMIIIEEYADRRCTIDIDGQFR